MHSDDKSAFSVLRPVCVEVMKTQNVKSMVQLQNLIKTFDSNIIQNLHEYLVFPLRIILQKGLSKEEQIIQAQKCLNEVFTKSNVKEWNLVDDIVKALLLCISNPQDGTIKLSGSEELVLSTLLCIDKLVNQGIATLWKNFYSFRNLPLLGHLVTICLDAMLHDHRPVKIAALSVLLHILSPEYCHNMLENEKDLLGLLIGDCFCSLMPGILSGVSKVLLGEQKLGHTVKCKALKVVSTCLDVVLGDKSIAISSNKEFRCLTDEINFKGIKQLEHLRKIRDDKWVESVASKVEIVLQRIIAVSQNPNGYVRLALVSFCKDVLFSCTNTLPNCVATLLKGILQLLHDEQPSVSEASQSAISLIGLELPQQVKDTVEDLLFNHCNNLPKNLIRFSDDDKVKSLQLMLGYLSVLKSNLKPLFYSSIQIEKLLNALMFCFKVDVSSSAETDGITPLAVQHNSLQAPMFHGQFSNWHFKKVFKNFTDLSIVTTLIKICRLLGQYGEIDVMFDLLYQSYTLESTKIEAVLLLNEILLGTLNRHDTQNLPTLISNLLEVYTSTENWYLVTGFESDYLLTNHSWRPNNSVCVIDKSVATSRKVSPLTIKSNVLLACILIEAISTFSQVLGLHFRPNLIVALYPVLEKVLDTNLMVSSCAVSSLQAIAKNCEYNNVSMLLCQNADYLVSTISIQLHHISLFPRCSTVLQAMILHSDKSVFYLIRGSITEVLDALDLHRQQHKHLLAFLYVLLTLVKSIKNWFKLDMSVEKPPSHKTTETSFKLLPEDVLVSLLELHKNKLASTNFEDSCEDETDNQAKIDNEPIVDESDTEPKTPAEIQVVQCVMERCCNLMANENPRIRLLVMEILFEGISALKRHENILLPLVHKLWSPLMVRFTDTELQVVSYSFDVVCIMTNAAGDFIRRRFTKDVLPQLVKLIKSSTAKSLSMKSNSSVYHHSTLFKLLHNVLCKLGPLLLNIHITFDHFHNVLLASWEYLSSDCDKELQNDAVKLYTNLIKIDADAVWYFLTRFSVANKDIDFRNSNFTNNGFKNASKFTVNANYLLKLCHV